MKYLHLFNSESEFIQQYYSQDYNEPWVSLTPVPIKFRMTWESSDDVSDFGTVDIEFVKDLTDDEYFYQDV